MATIIRSWTVTQNDIDNNYRLANSAGWFPFTMPSDYVAGDDFQIEFVGGLLADGTPFPNNAECDLVLTVATVNDLPPHSQALSSTGYSWAIGGHWKTWLADSSWTAEGLGQTISCDFFGLNNHDYTLADGSGGSPDLPNEGTLVESFHTYPFGWFPQTSVATNQHPRWTYHLEPSQQVECSFFFQWFTLDGANPTYAAYGAIESITLVYGATRTAIPLTSVTVGFGPQGSTGNAWPAPGIPGDYNYGLPWNLYRPISLGLPTISGAGADGYQDVFLEGGGGSVQGQIF